MAWCYLPVDLDQNSYDMDKRMGVHVLDDVLMAC